MVVRTCIGCRERADKSELVRFVQINGVITPDLDSPHHGRGAHLHPKITCLELATRRKAFGRALKFEGPIDASAIVALIEPRHQP